MKEINVNSKFGIGEKVYTIWNRSIGFTCPICNGDGAILHKGYKVKCTYCYGSGNVFTHEKMWQVDTEPMEVTGIKISINQEGKESISYTLHNANGRSRKRTDKNCFATIEEAQAYCDDLNVEIRAKVEKEIQVMQAKYDTMRGN